jgi:uncharacterized pyridoxamine 5'-phosphate oxidase family protein
VIEYEKSSRTFKIQDFSQKPCQAFFTSFSTFLLNSYKKDKALENSPIAKNIYKTPDNPVLKLIYLHTGEAILFNLSGSKSEKFSF